MTAESVAGLADDQCWGYGQHTGLAFDAGLAMANPESLRAAADKISDGASDVHSDISEAKGSWGALENHYSADETPEVLQAFDTPSDEASDLASEASSVASALRRFASEIESLQERLETYRSDLSQLEADITAYEADPDSWSILGIPLGFGEESWESQEDLASRDDNLRQRASDMHQDYADVIDECAGDIAAAYGGTPPAPAARPEEHYSPDDAFFGGFRAGVDDALEDLSTAVGNPSRPAAPWENPAEDQEAGYLPDAGDPTHASSGLQWVGREIVGAVDAGWTVTGFTLREHETEQMREVIGATFVTGMHTYQPVVAQQIFSSEQIHDSLELVVETGGQIADQFQEDWENRPGLATFDVAALATLAFPKVGVPLNAARAGRALNAIPTGNRGGSGGDAPDGINAGQRNYDADGNLAATQGTQNSTQRLEDIDETWSPETAPAGANQNHQGSGQNQTGDQGNSGQAPPPQGNQSSTDAPPATQQGRTDTEGQSNGGYENPRTAQEASDRFGAQDSARRDSGDSSPAPRDTDGPGGRPSDGSQSNAVQHRNREELGVTEPTAAGYQRPDMTPEQAAQLERMVDEGTLTRNSDGTYTLTEEFPIEIRRNQSHHSPAEFEAQIADYNRGLDQLTYGEIQHNRDWTQNHSDEARRVVSGERRRFRSELREEGYDVRGQDALHAPDTVLGGRPESFSGVGDRGVNRSIGPQVANQAGTVTNRLDDAFYRVPPELHHFIKPNIRLNFTDPLS